MRTTTQGRRWPWLSIFVLGCTAHPGAVETPAGPLPVAPSERAELVDALLAGWLERPCSAQHATAARAGEPLARQGSSVALTRRDGALYALVTDPERNAVHVVDVAQRRVASSTKVLGAPEQIQILADGRLVVSVSDRSHIEVFELGRGAAPELERRCARAVPAGPFGLALSADDTTLAVTSAWAAAVSFLDGATFATRTTVDVARAPRGVFIDDRGVAFVSHLVGGRVSRVDSNAPARGAQDIDVRVRAATAVGNVADLDYLREGTQAYALTAVEIAAPPPLDGERGKLAGGAPPAKAARKPDKHLVVPMISVDPGMPKRPTSFYYGPPPLAGIGKQAPTAVLVDFESTSSMSSRVLASSADTHSGACLIPRALAFGRASARLYVACLGLDQVQELDAGSADPMRAVRRTFDVPKGPTGVALEASQARLFVNAAFDRKLAVVALADGAIETIDFPSDGPHFETTISAGREIFYRTGDANITREGLACSSCHPDGGDDGVTWSTPEGPRQTPFLAGRLRDTAPYGWTRNEPTLDHYVSGTMARLGGTGLGDVDRAALVAYLKSMKAPPSRHAVSAEQASSGFAAFRSAGCAQCHLGRGATDARTHLEGFDTPSLAGVGLSAPYYHDGRYPTLEALLHDEHSEMAGVAQLSDSDERALATYLRSL